MRRVKTALGDIWHLEHDTAWPEHSRRVYGLTEIMQRIFKFCETDTRYAERLQIIANAQVTPDGNAFLIPDPDHEGFSRAVSFESPSFNWKQEDYSNGCILFNSDNPDYIIREIVADPGTAYGPYHIMKFNYDERMFTYLGTENDLEAASLQMDELIDKKVAPLPYIGYQESTFIGLPRGYRGEVIKEDSYELGIYEEKFRVHIIDRFDREVRELSTGSAAFLISLRDDSAVFEAAIDVEHKPSGILDLFAKSEEFMPRRFAEFENHMQWMEDSKVVKLKTADDEYELLLSYFHKREVYRDSKGRLISVGVPSQSQLEGVEGSVSFGTEQSYTAFIKRTNGVILTEVKNLALDLERLYDMITSEVEQEALIADAEEKTKELFYSPEDIELAIPMTRALKTLGGLSMDAADIVGPEANRTVVNVNKLLKNMDKSNSVAAYNF